MNGGRVHRGTLTFADALASARNASGALLEPLEVGDPAQAIEYEIGDYEEVYRYQDGHIESGRTRYTGEWKKIWVNAYEYTRLPILMALTDLTPGPVMIIERRKL